MTFITVKESINASIKVKTQLLDDDRLMLQIVDVASRCLVSLENGGKIIFCGNGGSFADAQHLSAEFTSVAILSILSTELFLSEIRSFCNVLNLSSESFSKI